MKRWRDIILAGIVAGLATWLAPASSGVPYSELFSAQYIVPAIVAAISTWLAFYQPSTIEGLKSSRKKE